MRYDRVVEIVYNKVSPQSKGLQIIRSLELNKPPLSYDEKLMWLPTVINVGAAHPDFLARCADWEKAHTFTLSATANLPLNTSLEFDDNIPANYKDLPEELMYKYAKPVNMHDYYTWRRCLASPKFAKSSADLAGHRGFIFDRTKEDKIFNAKISMTIEATVAFSKLREDKAKAMQALYILTLFKDTFSKSELTDVQGRTSLGLAMTSDLKLLSDATIEGALFKISQLNAELFVAVTNGKSLNINGKVYNFDAAMDLTLVSRALASNKITFDSGVYLLGNSVLGSSIADVIKFLKGSDPISQAISRQLKEELVSDTTSQSSYSSALIASARKELDDAVKESVAKNTTAAKEVTTK